MERMRARRAAKEVKGLTSQRACAAYSSQASRWACALKDVHVVQILMTHINALKTQLMHKNVQTNPEKSQKITQHSCCSMLTREKNLKAKGGNWYRFVPKGGTFPTENHHACCEKLRFVRSIYPNLPHMGQNLYHDMLMLLHDSMPSFMNFRRLLDLLEFKNQASQCFAGINGALVFEIHAHFLHGT